MQTEPKPGIDRVGVIDWNMRDFHGYSTHRGTTYNACLVRGEKSALIDTVKAPFFGEMWEQIGKNRSAGDPVHGRQPRGNGPFRALLAGSPTLHNNLFPTVAEFLTYVKGLRPKGRVVVAFGSCDWTPGVTKTVAAELQAAGLDVAGGIAVRYVPDADTLKRCDELGRGIAAKIKAS
ncbi:MAG TPA: hypothetical protein P5551_09565 [Syntrophales bacterium]|nr:hypothetical protein [Syntrophales bacterium]HRT62592.1 hypothetical protein [Syntrophales bacterium]